MSAETRSRLHKFARAAIGIVAGGSFVGMQQAGYVDGAATDVGVDAGTIRDTVAAILAMLAVWYPKFTRFGNLWKSLTNHDRVEALEAEIEALKSRLEGGTDATVSATRET